MALSKKHKLQLLVHVLTAFVLLLKGIDKLSHDHILSGGILLTMGIIVAILTFFGKKLGITHFTTAITTYLIEFAAILIIAYLMFHDGKEIISYLYVLAAMLFLMATFMTIRKHHHNK